MRAAGSWLDVGGDGFAPFVVGYADDGGLQHGGVAGEDVLDFLGVDVLSAADDHVLGPPDQRQVAVGVEVADVAGVQPAVDDDAGGFVGAAQIAAHDVGAGDDDLAIHPGRHLGAGVVDDADLLTRKRDPHRAGSAFTVDRVDGGGARSFRQSVALDRAGIRSGPRTGPAILRRPGRRRRCRTAPTTCRGERRRAARPAWCRWWAPPKRT